MNWGGRHAANVLSDVLELADQGVAEARSAISRAGRNLGQGLAALTNLMNPQRILLGGDHQLLANGAETAEFWGTMMESMEQYSFSNMQDACEVVHAVLGAEEAAGGAALLARRWEQNEQGGPDLR